MSSSFDSPTLVFIAQQGEPQGEARPFVSREEASTGGAEGRVDPPQGPNGPAPSQQEQCMSSLPWLIGMIAIFYFLLIRPQQKQEKARQSMLGSLREGQKVVTSGGIHGTVSSLNEQTVSLRVDPKVKLTVERQNVARILGDEEAPKTD